MCQFSIHQDQSDRLLYPSINCQLHLWFPHLLFTIWECRQCTIDSKVLHIYDHHTTIWDMEAQTVQTTHLQCEVDPQTITVQQTAAIDTEIHQTTLQRPIKATAKRTKMKRMQMSKMTND